MLSDQRNLAPNTTPPCQRAQVRDRIVACLLIAATIGALLYILFSLSDHLLGDPLGGPVIGPHRFDRQAYGQTVGLLITSIADTDIHVVLGLFVIAGFALGLDSDHERRHLIWKLPPLCAFTATSILAVFFAIKLKAGLLFQIGFDRVNIDLLRPAFEWHMLSLLFAGLSCFALVLLSLGPLARTRTIGS